jgi:DNA-directed RNA polymerase alpha subunit
MYYEDITNFWRTKGLSVRASNVLAKAWIENEETLLEKLTAFEKVLSLRNCGRLTAQEIWKFIGTLKDGESQEKLLPSYHNLSNRAKHVLEKLGVRDNKQLLQLNLTKKEIFKLSNVGVKTCEEIWSLVEHLRNSPEKKDETRSPDVALQEIPLLNTQVSSEIWDVLTNTPLNQIAWSVRTKKGILRYRCKTLADITKISGDKWLKLEHFGRRSLTELQNIITEIIYDPEKIEKFIEISIENAKELPLLGRNVSNAVWDVLQAILVNDIEWSVRTRNGINQKNCTTLSDIVSIPPNEWLAQDNFGRKSLVELQTRITEVLNNLLLSDKSGTPNASMRESTNQIKSLSDLGHEMLDWMKGHERDVIKLYHGYVDSPKTLEEVGKMFDLTRERIRQIKETANKRLLQKPKRSYLSKTVFNLFGEVVAGILSEKGGFCSIDELRQVIKERLNWGEEEQWIINWLDEVFGETWVLFGLNPMQEFIINFAKMLKSYGYRPIMFDEFMKLHSTNFNQPVKQSTLVTLIKSYPPLKMYEYSATYIGLKNWRWFNPEIRDSIHKTADLTEWFLRLTNRPSHAIEIVYGIQAKVGNFNVKASEIADACESKPDRFSINENGSYSLSIWNKAFEYKDSIECMLQEQSLHVKQIIHKLSPEDFEAAIASLYLYEDTFIETIPFEWSLKKNETFIDINNLTFEDLIPK